MAEKKTGELGCDATTKKTATAGGKDGTPQGGNQYHQMTLKPAFAIQREPKANIKVDKPYNTHTQSK
jgi:hypothetical protein